MTLNKGFVPQLLGVTHLLLLLLSELRPTDVSLTSCLMASAALQVAVPPPQTPNGDGDDVEEAEVEDPATPEGQNRHSEDDEVEQVEAPISTHKRNHDSDNGKKGQTKASPPPSKRNGDGEITGKTSGEGAPPPQEGNGDCATVKKSQAGASPSSQKRTGERSNVEKVHADGATGAVSTKAGDRVPHSASQTQNEEMMVSSNSASSFAGNGARFRPVEASADVSEGTLLLSTSSDYACATPSDNTTTRLSEQSRKHRKGAETFLNRMRFGASAARSVENPPAVYAAARAMASQIKALFQPLSAKRSPASGRVKRSTSKSSSSLSRPITHFLPHLPRRRGGLAEPTGCYSESAAKVIQYVEGLFPLHVRSAIHGGSTHSLAIDYRCPVFHSPGRVSLCVEFQHGKNSIPLLLTVLFLEDGRSLGHDAVQVLHRVAAAQHLAVRAGFPRAVDVAEHFRIGTPLDVVTLSRDDVIDLGSAVVVGSAVLERRIWSPLTSVLLRMDQAEGKKGIRLAYQARLSLTMQVVEVVSAIRKKKLVLPRVTLGDFWVDSGGNLLHLSRQVTDLLTEGDPSERSRTTGQVHGSQDSLGDASKAASSDDSEGLHAQSNSVGLALLILEMWCRLTPEQLRARTPAQETAARQLALDFSTCLPSLPSEVKELVTLLHGGVGRPSIPVAEAVSSNPFQVLQTRLRHAEVLEGLAQRNRETVQLYKKGARPKESSTPKIRVPWTLHS